MSNNSSSGFQFGKSAFGSNAGQSPFGSGSDSPFGSNKNTPTSGSGLFGNVGAPASSGGSLFGSASSPKPSIFGAAPSTANSKPTFGTAFSTASSQTPFGAQSQTPNPKTTAGASTPGQTSGLFGNTGNTGGSIFGSTAAATPASSGTGFSLASTTPAGPPPQGGTSGKNLGLFNLNTTSATAPTTTAQSSSAAGLFSNASGFRPPAPSSGGGLFSNATKDSAKDTPASTAEGATKSLFSTPAPSSTGTSSLFKMGTSGADSTPKPAFPSLGGTTAVQQSSPATPTTSSPQKSLFNLGATTMSAGQSAMPAAAPSGSTLFSNLGAPKPTATTTTTAATTAAAAPTTQPATTTSSLFSKPAETAPSTVAGAQGTPSATTAPATSTATTTTGTTAGATTGIGGAALGASTAGPAPPAQSRLKNKTMDEIITRWATDLTKYQKEFREQAEKVAEWDRMIVENGTKVQKLYGSTVDAERATLEVERQLASVEGQQEELGAWLDRYEREVDEMMSKQVGPGEALQGPDQERERTYKLAEKMSDRLEEMGKDLTSMIEEVNGVSATLSKTNKADEPVAQIVRILNSHLYQLQIIDQGTSELKEKIAAAQKTRQGLASKLGYRHGTPGVGNGSAADDFYRSYMGRR
ncbi:Nucleoporin-62 C-terminal-like protein [Monascus purpureus]|uniref:Nucleoporin NSP1 n=1 Tax=Monascus purpureus TaxID=5098 RepID=A0A507QP99_MONPU|nr:Nucleoporin-62 C-terminal-like protein [Monascus purpureus]BDD59838.1 hypothetical protein MAP00_005022 [Monascus purpureus]